MFVLFSVSIVTVVHLGQLAVSRETGPASWGRTQRTRIAPQSFSTLKTEPKPYTMLNNRLNPGPKQEEFKLPLPPAPTHTPSEGISSFEA